ncbi:MAG: response regulator, partial [bacterium]
GGVAHNINNLLTGIIGNLSLSQGSNPEEIPELIAMSLGTADRAAQLVQQLLTFSRKSLIEAGPLDVNSVVDETARLARQSINRRMEIEIHKEKNLPIISADAAQMQSVLMNLCLNARDAIEKVMSGGVASERQADQFAIRIQTETVLVDQEYCDTHSYARPGRFVVLSVSDNGSGMDPETQRHVFEPFFTTKGLAEGSGMGLASAYGYIKQHGGWIDFSSELGKGTTFRVYSPVTEEEVEKDETECSEEVRGGTETILLVDDEEQVLDIGEKILECCGYRVILAADGREGLNLYLREQDHIDLIVLDLWMPRLSGHEFLERLQVIAPATKVVVSTGLDQEKERESLDQLGVAGYVSKPYRAEDLAREVRRVLDRS